MSRRRQEKSSSRWDRWRVLLSDSVVRPSGHGLGSIFFIPNPWIGLIFWLALFSRPRFGFYGVVGLLVGIACKRLLRLGEDASLGGGVKANALLAAVTAAWLLDAQAIAPWFEVPLVAGAAALAAVVTAALMNAMGRTRFPVMVTGYCLVAASLFVLCPLCTVASAARMAAWPQPADWSGWLESFLRAMGALVYSPSLSFGLLVCLGMLLWSRAAFITGVAAWIAGTLMALVLQNMGFVYVFLPLSYNFFIVGVALGAVLFLPSRQSLLVAVCGGGLSAYIGLVIQAVAQGGAISYLPISSILTVWIGIGAISLAGGQAAVVSYRASRFPPEMAWRRSSYLERRFGRRIPLLAVPLAGVLEVTQGFDGAITHRGEWRHAIDFQRPSVNRTTVQFGDASLWGCFVLSPVDGTVECIKADVRDNVLGGSNFRDNWGNYAIIRHDGGGWVLLAHMMYRSLAVIVGQRVTAGMIVGRVGNSGRSPVPHLHLQLQSAAALGSPTIPFKLANYSSPADRDTGKRLWHASGIPIQGEVVETLVVNPRVYDLLTGMMPGSAVWFCRITGRVPESVLRSNAERTARIDISLDESGRYHFDSGKGGRLVASLEADAWRITELERVSSSLLGFLGMAVPSIPYVLAEGLGWHDVPPTPIVGLGLADSISPFIGKNFPEGFYECGEIPGVDEAIVVKASIESRQKDFPRSLTCRFESLRGPVAVHIEYPDGVVDYSLLSFEAGLPESGSSMATAVP